MKRLGFFITILAMALLAAIVTAGDMPAAAVTVNSAGDTEDGDTSSIGNLIANPGPDGLISLYEAIEAANNTPGAKTINFNIPGCSGRCVIGPKRLPSLTGGQTTIDGYSQPGAAPATGATPAVLMIEFNGGGFGGDGLHITSAGNVIQGLWISDCFAGSHAVVIEGNQASGNTISGNVLYDNNYGLLLGGGAKNNLIGGDAPAERNIISDNFSMGLTLHGEGTSDNVVSGNYIGTDGSGVVRWGNHQTGVYITNCASGNLIGGDNPGQRNVISGNSDHGVYIIGECSSSNVISGNYIGVDATGVTAMGNSERGVYLSGSVANIIGGDSAGERNVIAGNGFIGVEISGSKARDNIISGNYIGVDASGTVALGNGIGDGVRIYNRADNNTVGGDTAGEGNVISGHDYDGVRIFNASNYSGPKELQGNKIWGNLIGTDANGTAPLPNRNGVAIGREALETSVIGNVISANKYRGVYISSASYSGHTIAYNIIGADVSGTSDLGNGDAGILIYDSYNLVGPGNIIAYNGVCGVEVNGSGVLTNLIRQNSIFGNDGAGMGIDLVGGAHDAIAPPLIQAAPPGSGIVSGTACAGCAVDLFGSSDADGEGEKFLAETTAGPGGDFSLSGVSFEEPYLTATATDPARGTSEFSVVYFVVDYPYDVYLPMVRSK